MTQDTTPIETETTQTTTILKTFGDMVIWSREIQPPMHTETSISYVKEVYY